MDWDDVRPQPKVLSALGEDLSRLSVADLEERIAALRTEISRVEAEIAARRRHEAAAAAVFKK